jgi:hypothetical protein
MFRDSLSITFSRAKQIPEERIPYVIYWRELCIFQIHLVLKKKKKNVLEYDEFLDN